MNHSKAGHNLCPKNDHLNTGRSGFQITEFTFYYNSNKMLKRYLKILPFSAPTKWRPQWATHSHSRRGERKRTLGQGRRWWCSNVIKLIRKILNFDKFCQVSKMKSLDNYTHEIVIFIKKHKKYYFGENASHFFSISKKIDRRFVLLFLSQNNWLWFRFFLSETCQVIYSLFFKTGPRFTKVQSNLGLLQLDWKRKRLKSLVNLSPLLVFLLFLLPKVFS
jgi:hypothetical protein